MSKILLAISALLIAASAFFGFAAKNKIGDLRGTNAQLDLRAKSGEKAAAEAVAARKASEEQLAVANTKAEAATAEATTAKEELTKAQAQSAELQTQIAAKDAEINKLTVKVATPDGQPPVAASSDELVQAQTQLKELQTKLAESQEVNKTLTARADDAESKMKGLQEKETKRQGRFMAKGLEGSILAVNQGWSFVVLGIGDRQGVVANAEMIIVRGGQAIGKVRVSSVEPSTAIADIVPGTLAKGVRVQPGDRVIYPGGA